MLIQILLTGILFSVTARAEPPHLRFSDDRSGVVRIPSPDGKAQARFTLISSHLIRMEFSKDGKFVDEKSLFAVNRDSRYTNYSVSEVAASGSQVVEIRTFEAPAVEKLTLRYVADGRPFDAANLTVSIHDPLLETSWKPGDRDSGNLGGSLPSLDLVSGSVTPIDEHFLDQPWIIRREREYWRKPEERPDPREKVSDGLLSRSGWHLIDDSLDKLLVNDWPADRTEGSGIDWYFFGYGRDYRGALRDLAAIGGDVPLPRKQVLGSWYSRYFKYSASDYARVVNEYELHAFPLDGVVLDAFWHKLNKNSDGSINWAGYSFNPELIPDPKALLDWFHAKGLFVTLNDHHDTVGEGVPSDDPVAPRFRLALGDYTGTQVQPDAFYDRRYTETFFHVIHDPLQAMGVDFWWLDCWNHLWTNEVYFRQSKAQGLRGQGFSRAANWGFGMDWGWGDHRHPIHFSGDTFIGWPALALEVPFSATSGNSGLFYWTHDIGGFHFFPGVTRPSKAEQGELFARWAQFGAFSAAVRLHSTNDPELDRRPWLYGARAEDSIRRSLELRSRLMPYIYSTAWQAHAETLPLLRPLYLEFPGVLEAYRNPQEYLFGDAFLVAPITSAIGSSGTATQRVWLPGQGPWYPWFKEVRGEAHGLDTFPLYVRGGIPIPMQPVKQRMTTASLDDLIIRVYPGRDGELGRFTLYEDDGRTEAYRSDAYAKTRLSYRTTAKRIEIRIEPEKTAGFTGRLVNRKITVELPEVRPVSVKVDGLATSGAIFRDGVGVIPLGVRSVSKALTLQVSAE